MCEVGVVMAIGAGISAIASGVSTGIQIDAQQKAAGAQAEAAERNAQVAMAQRQDLLQRGLAEAKRAERAGRAASGTARAQLASSDLAVAGTAAAAVDRSNVNAAIDAARIRATAARQAWGIEQEAYGLGQSAEQARQAGVLGSVATGLQGANQIIQTGISFAKSAA